MYLCKLLNVFVQNAKSQFSRDVQEKAEKAAIARNLIPSLQFVHREISEAFSKVANVMMMVVIVMIMMTMMIMILKTMKMMITRTTQPPQFLTERCMEAF